MTLGTLLYEIGFEIETPVETMLEEACIQGIGEEITYCGPQGYGKSTLAEKIQYKVDAPVVVLDCKDLVKEGIHLVPKFWTKLANNLTRNTRDHKKYSDMFDKNIARTSLLLYENAGHTALAQKQKELEDLVFNNKELNDIVSDSIKENRSYVDLLDSVSSYLFSLSDQLLLNELSDLEDISELIQKYDKIEKESHETPLQYKLSFKKAKQIITNLSNSWASYYIPSKHVSNIKSVGDIFSSAERIFNLPWHNFCYYRDEFLTDSKLSFMTIDDLISWSTDLFLESESKNESVDEVNAELREEFVQDFSRVRMIYDLRESLEFQLVSSCKEHITRLRRNYEQKHDTEEKPYVLVLDNYDTFHKDPDFILADKLTDMNHWIKSNGNVIVKMSNDFGEGIPFRTLRPSEISDVLKEMEYGDQSDCYAES
ncbi:hypothetical protein GF327_06940, partial [Candidatus Woesearchaeota archaeon]|nr:hypothetical protein [Candidatus Woesearchaeota archaeon]